MRVRDHVLLSTLTATALRPLLGPSTLRFWAGAVLVDIDHYAWFCVRARTFRPTAAVRYFNRAQPARHASTRTLHTPCALLGAAILGLRRPRFLPVAAGMAMHVGLDSRHEARMQRARARALERDRFSCRACGARSPDIGTHVWRQPWLLPSYCVGNLVSLCDDCHELAHAGEAGTVR